MQEKLEKLTAPRAETSKGAEEEHGIASDLPRIQVRHLIRITSLVLKAEGADMGGAPIAALP